MRKGWIRDTDSTDVLKGLAAGAVGGLVGAWAMNQFHAAVSKATQPPEDEAQKAGEEEPGDAQAAERGREQGGEPPTVLAAERISHGLLHHELTPRERRVAGPVMHYGFGVTMGALYGAGAEVMPSLRLCQGTVYGTAVWLAADEGAVPALGLAKPPNRYPVSTHVSGWGAHIVFGLVAESVRRSVRALL